MASDSVPNTALHEFVHAVTAAALGSVYEKEGITHMPQYLSEGIACYEAGEYAYSFMDANELIKSGKFPDFDELEKMNYHTNPEVYSLGSLFCEYVAKQYGQDKLVEILRTLDIEAALGGNKKDIQARWLEYLKQEYHIK